MLYGADGQIEGKEAILSVIRQLIGLSEDSLNIDVHTVVSEAERRTIANEGFDTVENRLAEFEVEYFDLFRGSTA